MPTNQKRSAKIKAEGRFFAAFAKDRPFRGLTFALRKDFKNSFLGILAEINYPLFSLCNFQHDGSAAFYGGAFTEFGSCFGEQPFSRGWNPALPSGVAGIFILRNSLIQVGRLSCPGGSHRAVTICPFRTFSKLSDLLSMCDHLKRKQTRFSGKIVEDISVFKSPKK